MNRPEKELSIIIVGFNAIDFLKLTLDAVEKAIENIDAEVLLIDNSDNLALQTVVRHQYRFVCLLPNKENLGFAKANNIGLNAAGGRLAILLNPDTLVAEDTFKRVLDYYRQHPYTGGLGVKMIDGRGQYLKESKRGFPGIRSSFFKLTGLHKVFPRSKNIAAYYQGHLKEQVTHPVDILSGAFLVIPRDNEGNFTHLDERYFMYGEDIDLSCQLKAIHGTNIYFPETTIVHFKGQSTNMNPHILWHFYHSMWLFYQQHLYHKHPAFINQMIKLSIKTITHLHTWRNNWFRKKFKSINKQAFNSIRLLSSNTILLNTLQQHFETPIQVSTPAQLNAVTNVLSIFDFNEISCKQAINLMEAYPNSYGFITKDHSSLIICDSSGGKGQVIHLK